MKTEYNFTQFTEELAKFFSHYYNDSTWMIGQEGDTPSFTQEELQLGIYSLLSKYKILLPNNLHSTVKQIIHIKDLMT